MVQGSIWKAISSVWGIAPAASIKASNEIRSGLNVRWLCFRCGGRWMMPMRFRVFFGVCACSGRNGQKLGWLSQAAELW
jgi:hypothetical protein